MDMLKNFVRSKMHILSNEHIVQNSNKKRPSRSAFRLRTQELEKFLIIYTRKELEDKHWHEL